MDRASFLSRAPLRHLVVHAFTGIALCSAILVHAASEEPTVPGDGSATLPATSSSSLSIDSPVRLPNATKGGSYFYALQASGGTPPYSWSLSSQNGATEWLVMPDGWLEGTATRDESDSVTVTLTDAAGQSSQRTFELTVDAHLAMVGQDSAQGSVSLPPAREGAAYSHTLQAAGGSGPYSWSIASGSLPAGLTLSSSGEITGTPSAAGSLSGIVFAVTDNTNSTATANSSITVAPASVSQVARPAYNTGRGFFVSHGKLYDPSGHVFRIRGVNRNHYDMADQPGISRSGANTVRFFMYNIGVSGAAPASTYENVALQQHIDHRELPIITASNVAGTTTRTTGEQSTAALSSTVSWWVHNVGAFAPIMDRIAINIANEWGPANSATWAAAYESAIARLRAAGYSCPLVIDAGSWGQDFGDLLNYSTRVFDSDPERNIIFSLHLYYNAASALSQNILPQLASLSASRGMVFIVGEFGPGRNVGPSPTLVTPGQIIRAAEKSGLGWMPWSWDSNNLPHCRADNNGMSMTAYCGQYNVPSDLTNYGRDVILNPVYGLKRLAQPPSF
jgi:mannan endo-1,4-beta-mannosidase